jgi:hypothetical protein
MRHWLCCSSRCLFIFCYHAPPPAIDPDKYWVELLDIVYAHALLWDSVPPHPMVIGLWLSRLVDYEVSRFFSIAVPVGF